MNMTKTYKAIRQFIGAGIKNEDGSNTNELYRLEQIMNDAIVKVVNWREKHFKEKHWEEALPQTLLTILEGYDKNAGEVAAECFLKVPAKDYGKGIEKKVNKD